MKVSLRYIAETLKISKTTVSWVLSEKGAEKGISEATIQKVKDYAVKVNYQPNLLARSLSTGHTNTIGLIVPFISDSFYAELAQAIEKEAEKYNYILTICSSEGNYKREIELIRVLRAKQVDGLIIAPTHKSIKEIKKLREEKFPFILLDRYFPKVDTNYILVNNEESSYNLTCQLLQSGCKKIALISSDSHLLVMQLRIDGYTAALKASSHILDPSLVVEVNRSQYAADIKDKLDNLLEKHPDVDGLFFATHYLALETLRHFMQSEINYNKRFKMACFHDTKGLDMLAPKMIFSRMPIDTMGVKAIEILLANVKDKHIKPCSLILDNE